MLKFLKESRVVAVGMPVTRHPTHHAAGVTCGTITPRRDSCLKSDAETLLLLVPCSVRSTLLPAAVCRSRPSEHGSPRPEAFSPQTPPVVGHAVGVIVHLCSFASSILCLRPTSQARTCQAFGLWPSPTGPTVNDSRSPLGSPLRGVGSTSRRPVSVQRVCVHAPVL